jgi:transposase-like protein
MMMTLAEVTSLTEGTARQYLESLLWPDGPLCPHCKGKNATRIDGESARPGLLMCNDCRKQFTVTVGTIFEDSHIPLRSWVIAFQMMCASQKGLSAKQLQRQLGFGSYETAWFMCHRIRHAMENGPLAELLKGTVECDETVETLSNGPAVRLERLFSELAAQWRKETGMLSVIQQKAIHPAYQRIIGIGKPALPLIFQELQRKRDHWIWALRAITGEDAAKPEHNFKQAVDAWLDWGRTRGYL